MDTSGRPLPIACEGVSLRRPIVFGGLIAFNLVIWIALAAMIVWMIGG